MQVGGMLLVALGIALMFSRKKALKKMYGRNAPDSELFGLGLAGIATVVGIVIAIIGFAADV